MWFLGGIYLRVRHSHRQCIVLLSVGGGPCNGTSDPLINVVMLGCCFLGLPDPLILIPINFVFLLGTEMQLEEIFVPKSSHEDFSDTT